MVVPENLTGREVFRRVALDSVRNIVFWIVGAGVIGWMARPWPTAAGLLMWAYVGLVALSVLHFVVLVLLPALVSYAFMLWHREIPGDEPWLSLGMLPRVVELFVALVGVGYVLTMNGRMSS